LSGDVTCNFRLHDIKLFVKITKRILNFRAMLNFGFSHAEKTKSFRRIKGLITPKFREKMFKVPSNDEFNVAK